ncbi:MAG: hypothetical protein JW959_08845 [Pirellulales bacterium]|nr:hypothetical protein [Pirellulales bacterium]
MLRLFLSVGIVFCVAGAAGAQDGGWHTPEEPQAAASDGAGSVLPASASLPMSIPGGKSLPNDAGQVWHDYDISGYTARVTSTNRPEQAIVDWILRETGYEAWHSGPVSILNADHRALRVYHTPEMHKLIADVVDRFTSSEAASYSFSMRVVTLDSPGWRTIAQRLMNPVSVRTPGISAWVLAKEDAAILLGELRRRRDYREHSSPYLIVGNGQSTVVSAMRGRPYVRGVIARPDVAAGFEPDTSQIDEGFALDFSPLITADHRLIDAAIRCEINQIEKIIPVMIDVPTQTSPGQRTKIEVPQVTQYRFHERFRWPVEKVLLVGMGMAPLPIPVDGAPLVPGVPLPIGKTPARADLLVFVECKGQVAPAADASEPGRLREAKNYRGRY